MSKKDNFTLSACNNLRLIVSIIVTALFHLIIYFSDMRRDVQEIFRDTPHSKQVMMFSATLSKDIRPVCKKFMQDVIPIPVHINSYLGRGVSICISFPTTLFLTLVFFYVVNSILTSLNPLYHPLLHLVSWGFVKSGGVMKKSTQKKENFWKKTAWRRFGVC